MLGISFVELVLILGVFFVLFGPRELPHLARGLLRVLNEMKHIFHSLQKEWGLVADESPTPPGAPAPGSAKKKPPSKRDPLKSSS